MIYFHGTSKYNLNKIINSGYIGIKYFDDNGVFLTPDFYHACLFGDHILEIKLPINIKKIDYKKNEEPEIYINSLIPIHRIVNIWRPEDINTELIMKYLNY